jgi:hypothetical protein
MTNQIQIPNEMPKQVPHDKDAILNSFQNLILAKESIIKRTYVSENLPSPLFAKEG